RDVVREDQTKLAAGRHDVAPADLDPEKASILAPVLSDPGIPRLDAGRPIPAEPGEGIDLLGREDVADCHPQKLLPCVAVLREGRVVDRQKFQSVRIAQPHRKWIDLEERAVALLSLAQTLLRHAALHELADPAAEVG